MTAYETVLADLRAKRAQIDQAIVTVEELMRARDSAAGSQEGVGDHDFCVQSRTDETPPEHDRESSRNDSKTRRIGMMILRSPGNNPERTLEICRQEGIETTLNTVDELRRYYRKCIKLMVVKEEEELTGKETHLQGKTDKIGLMILKNLRKSDTQIFQMCGAVGIQTTAKTVHGYCLYFHQCLDNLAILQKEKAEDKARA